MGRGSQLVMEFNYIKQANMIIIKDLQYTYLLAH